MRVDVFVVWNVSDIGGIRVDCAGSLLDALEVAQTEVLKCATPDDGDIEFDVREVELVDADGGKMVGLALESFYADSKRSVFEDEWLIMRRTIEVPA